MKRAVVTATALGGNASTEFVVATLPPVPLPQEAGGLLLSFVVIDGFINITPNGATITSVTLRIRRGSIAGSLVGPAQVITAGLAPGSASAIPIAAADAVVQATPPTIPGQVYVVTAIQAGTTLTAPTVNYAVVTATTS